MQLSLFTTRKRKVMGKNSLFLIMLNFTGWDNTYHLIKRERPSQRMRSPFLTNKNQK